MVPTRPALAAALALLVAGCIGSPSAPLSGQDVASGKATLRVEPQIRSGGFRTQATISPYTAADVEVLVLALYKLDALANETVMRDAQGQPMIVTIPKASLQNPVAFEKLFANTTYRVKATAFADAGGTVRISTQDEASRTDIAIAQDDRPTLAALKVQLIDKGFDGQGSTTVAIASGSLSPVGSERITVLETPAP